MVVLLVVIIRLIIQTFVKISHQFNVVSLFYSSFEILFLYIMANECHHYQQ